MPALPSSFEFGVGTHTGFVIVCLVAGAAFWLMDDFIAERTDLEREMPFDFQGVPRPDQDRSDRDQFRENSANTARYVGKWLVGIGLVLGLGLIIRLVL